MRRTCGRPAIGCASSGRSRKVREKCTYGRVAGLKEGSTKASTPHLLTHPSVHLALTLATTHQPVQSPRTCSPSRSACPSLTGPLKTTMSGLRHDHHRRPSTRRPLGEAPRWLLTPHRGSNTPRALQIGGNAPPCPDHLAGSMHRGSRGLLAFHPG